MEKYIYLDNAATTPLSPVALAAIQPFLTSYYGNASSQYGLGDISKQAVNDARSTVANIIDCHEDEIHFTSGGTESNNWALIGIAEANRDKGKHIITSKIEHPSVINTCKYLESRGYEITYLDVDSDGNISLEELEESLKEDTILISIMYVNNEIGTIQNVKQIGDIAKKRNVLFHTDAVQAVGHTYIDVESSNIDLLSCSGHKFGAPKGVGFLYVRRDTPITSYMHGGHQEYGMRAGTENVAGIVGLSAALQDAHDHFTEWNTTTQSLRNYLYNGIKDAVPDVVLNGASLKERVSGNLNLRFPGISNETLSTILSVSGIYVSIGSACNSGTKEPSHVLSAIGLPPEETNESIRFSLSHNNTYDEMDEVIDMIRVVVNRLRNN